MNFPQVGGGVRFGVAQDLEFGATAGIFVILLLVIVFPQSIPDPVVTTIKSHVGSIASLGIVLAISYLLGPMAGLFAALSFLFIWSRRQVQYEKIPEGFSVGPVLRPTLLVTSPVEANIVPDDHRWFVEKVLKEHPYIIEDDRVKTSAVQDDSQSAQYNSRNSR